MKARKSPINSCTRQNRSSFNGAAPMKARKYEIVLFMIWLYIALQWSRADEGAEI